MTGAPLTPVALVVNPAAARAQRGLQSQVTAALLPLGLEWVLPTRGPGHAGELAAGACAQGARLVVALGGDGTVAQVAAAAAEAGVAMAPVPAGGANVFARAMGWTIRAPDGPERLVAALESASLRRVVLGSVRAGPDERPFVINAGIGVDADAVHWVEARPRTKGRLRDGAFAIGAALAVARATGRREHLAVSVDGGPAATYGALAVATGSPYTYLGPWAVDMLPAAAFDGVLAWLALRRVTPWSLGRAVTGGLGRQGHLGSRGVAAGSARVLEVAADQPIAVQADGEPLGWHREIVLGRGPDLQTVVPALKSDGAPPN